MEPGLSATKLISAFVNRTMFSVSFIGPIVGFSPTLADLSTDDLLAVAKRLAIGGVEEIDPRFQCALDERPAFFFAEAPGVVAAVAAAITHAPEGDAGDIEASATGLRIFHRYLG